MIKRFLIALLALLLAAPAYAVDITPSRGGGSCDALTGSEVYKDLSSASFTMAASDMGKKYILYSSADGKNVTLPAANASGMALAKAAQFCVAPKSKGIKVLNAGTAGTDAILEAFLLPNASAGCYAGSISTAAGDWKCQGRGLFHGPVPVTLPFVADAGVDAGSVLLTSSMHGLGQALDLSLQPNENLTRLSSTLYVTCAVPNAGTSVVCYAVSYNHATDAWTWGAPVTAFSSANQWSYPSVIGLNATTYAVLAWEATAAKASARAATVSGTTITQGTTIQSGSWSVNPNNNQATLYDSVVADSSSTFFWASKYDASHLGLTHFSVSGTTLTQDGGAAFGSSAPGTGIMNGSSSAANVIELAAGSAGSNAGVSRYTYGAGSVTSTWDRRSRKNFSGGTVLWAADVTNRIYYVTDGTSLARFVLNAGFTEFTEQQSNGLPVLTGNGAPVIVPMGQLLFLSDSEALAYRVNSSATNGSFTLFDPTTALRARQQIPAGTSSDSGFANHVLEALMGFSSQYGTALGVDVNTSNRRMAFFATAQSQSIAVDRLLVMAMFDLPRNYDQAIQ